ncbi:ferredoxin [Actinomadura welshii]
MSDIEIGVAVHPDRCMAMGFCRAVAPGVFGAGDDGWVHLLEPHPAAERLDDVQDAADSCPLGAIEVHVRQRR